MNTEAQVILSSHFACCYIMHLTTKDSSCSHTERHQLVGWVGADTVLELYGFGNWNCMVMEKPYSLHR